MTTGPAAPRRARFEATLAHLRDEIRHGRYRAGPMLPGERDLSATFTVSRTTVRRMLSILVDEGLLRHRQGVGTFLANGADVPSSASAIPRPAALPHRLQGFTDRLRGRGIAASSKILACSLRWPTPEEAMLLACGPQEEVVQMHRLRCGGGRPLAIDETVVPRRYLPHPKPVDGSLYAALESAGFPPVRALVRLQGATLDDRQATLFGMAPGAAAIATRRTAYLSDGRCCDVTFSVVPAAGYDMIAEERAG